MLPNKNLNPSKIINIKPIILIDNVNIIIRDTNILKIDSTQELISKDTSVKVADDIYHSKAPKNNNETSVAVLEPSHSLEYSGNREKIVSHFMAMAEILSHHGVRGARGFNKPHEIMQILEMQNIVQLAVESGELSKDTTLHLGILSYDKAPDLILHTTVNGLVKTITIQLKSLNAVISKKNLNALTREYSTTDMIVINVKEEFISRELALSRKFELDKIERIYFTTINQEAINQNTQWIISVLASNFIKKNLDNINFLNEFYLENNKSSNAETNNELWYPIDKKTQEICALSLRHQTRELCSQDNPSSTISDIYNIKSREHRSALTLVEKKTLAARDFREKFVPLDSSENKFGSLWYTSSSRAHLYQADNIPLTSANIFIGIATGFDK